MTPLIYRYFTDHRNMMRRFWGLGGHYGKGKDGEETRLISKWYVDPFSSLLAKQKSRDLFLWGIIRIISIKLKQQKAQNMLLSFLSFFWSWWGLSSGPWACCTVLLYHWAMLAAQNILSRDRKRYLNVISRTDSLVLHFEIYIYFYINTHTHTYIYNNQRQWGYHLDSGGGHAKGG